MATEILVNIGSGNGFVPDGTKPLPEPMLTDYQWSPVIFILRQFQKKWLNHPSITDINLKIMSKILFLPGANELNGSRISTLEQQ